MINSKLRAKRDRRAESYCKKRIKLLRELATTQETTNKLTLEIKELEAKLIGEYNNNKDKADES